MNTRISTLAIITLLCTSCGKKAPQTAAPASIANEQGHVHLKCTITPSKTVVLDDEKVSFTISIVGGEPPYTIPALKMTGTQKTQITVTGAFENHTSTNRVVNNQVQVSDNDGETTSCSFSLTVKPGT